MLVSDFIGGLGGVMLAIAPLKDQYYRFKHRNSQNQRATSPWPALRNVIMAAWEKRRNEYDGIDSIFTLSGALALFLSFILKTVDL